jgi:beta-glucosidase
VAEVRPADLTLEEKCRLLGGASFWRTHAIERVGVPAVRMSDGPNGVRGEGRPGGHTPGVCVPAGIALGATWNPELVGEIGALLGAEAVRKGVHVLLGPTVNLQRVPVGGRVFECYSEDPELTARLGVAFVRGVQSRHVAVAVKHFVANDSEVDRFSVDVRLPERALRELYLHPFEAAVHEGGAWAVMSAYNRLNGEFCAAKRGLLHDILREEWGFDGVVVSDWFGAHDSAPSARAGLTLAMPGPDTIYGPKLVDAVNEGAVDEADVDALVGDVLRLIERTRAATLSADREEQSVDDPIERALCRRAVVEGLVLVANNGVLPLQPSTRVAVIGPNAAATRIMGGGSANLEPLPFVSILGAIEARLEQHPVFEPGVRIDRRPPPAGPHQLRTPDGSPGLLVEYRNAGGGAPVVTDLVQSAQLFRFRSVPDGVDPSSFTMTMRGEFVPDRDGAYVFTAALTGAGQVRVGNSVLLDDPGRALPRGPLFFGTASEEQSATLDCAAGVPLAVTMTSTGRGGSCGIRLGVAVVDPPDLIERAVAAAVDADVAVVVVGTTDEWETEGQDRPTMSLPGSQDELVARVAAANPDTVVVVNAGSPIAMPWVGDVAAILLASFGGLETGPGVADVLAGDADPGGRLPITYPRALEDTPAWPHYPPVDGAQVYGEGVFMGYRGFDRSGLTPLFPFGHGLSYGASTWSVASISSPSIHPGGTVTVRLVVQNSGDRDVTDVVQVYVHACDPPVERPAKELAAWRKVVTAPGGATAVNIELGPGAFRRWDDVAGNWVVDLGEYELLVAASATDVHQCLQLHIG